MAKKPTQAPVIEASVSKEKQKQKHDRLSALAESRGPKKDLKKKHQKGLTDEH